MKAFGIKRKRRDERGNIAPLAVASTLMLFVVLAFSVDQGIACVAKVQQENALDTARNSCMSASRALLAKNSEDPGLTVAAQFVQTLRDQGFEGLITVWFYEVPAAELPVSRRIWGIAVQLQEHIPTIFARGYGLSSIAVASKRIVIAEPFSSGEVWRPDHVGQGNGRYDVKAAQDSAHITFTGLGGFRDYPDQLRRDTQAAITNVLKKYGKEDKA